MARRTKEDAEETKHKLLMSALDVFSEKGYSSATLNDIAVHAGTTRGAIYWHFDSKEDLVASLLREMKEREEHIVAKTVPECSSLDDLQKHFVERARVLTQDKICIKFAQFVSVQIEHSVELIEAIAKEMGPIKHWVLSDIQNVIEQAKHNGELRDDIEAEEVIDLLRGLWVGLVKTHIIGMTTTALPRSIELGIQAILESIRSRKNTDRADGLAKPS
jgi:AcrR family transcriptional regulator